MWHRWCVALGLAMGLVRGMRKDNNEAFQECAKSVPRQLVQHGVCLGVSTSVEASQVTVGWVCARGRVGGWGGMRSGSATIRRLLVWGVPVIV